jgi:Na+/proline symporter
MEILALSSALLIGMFAYMMYAGKDWGGSVLNFLFANRNLQSVSTSLAITSHWFWAIAIFVGPAVAYNWGLIGLLWFAIPNGFACVTVGYMAYKVREKYPEGISVTEYFKQNLSPRIAILYQGLFVLISIAAVLLAFTAINKLWAFTALNQFIPPIYASLLIGLITLAFTVRGGIRTSIFTGAVQTCLWSVFLSVMLYFVFTSGTPLQLSGKNQLTTIFHYGFLTSFAVAFFISVSAAASAHGMMWQKAFSMPRENIMKTYSVAGLVFSLIVIALGFLGIYTYSAGLTIGAADTSQMIGMLALVGPTALIIFAALVIGQSSTVIDSSLNYISSLATLEWIKTDNVLVSRSIMVAFMVIAWLISWAQLEIWTILMLMASVRIVMFVPMLLHVLGQKLIESFVFYSSIISVAVAVYFAWTAKMTSTPIYDMYAALIALGIPVVSFIVGLIIRKFNYLGVKQI